MTLARAYLTTVVCQAVAAVAAVLSLRWVTVYVAPETFGRYALYLSVVSAGTLFLVSWPNAALLRFGREEWTTSGRVGATLGARTTLFAIFAALAIAIAWLFDAKLQRFLDLKASPFLWVALGVMVLPASELLIYLSQAVGKTEAYGYTPLVTKAGFLIAVLLIPVLHPSPDWTYLVGALLSSTVAAATLAAAVVPRGVWSGFSVRRDTIAALVRYSWALPLAGISTYVVNWIDSWVIGSVLGIASVGVYNWAYQTTAIASLAFAPIAVVLTPRVIDARLRNDALRLERYARSIVPAVMLLAAAIAAALPLVQPALRYLVSPTYGSVHFIIVILMAALPFQLISYLVTPIGNAYEGVVPRFVGVSAAMAIVNAVGDVVLVPRLGIAGAAIATVGALAMGAMAQVSVVAQVGINFGPRWQYLCPAVLAPGVAVLIWIGWWPGAALLAATSAAIVVFFFVFKATHHRLHLADQSAIIAIGRALTLTE